MSVVSYCSMTQENPITGEKEQVSLSPDEEIALGLQAAPELINQHGGELPDPRGQDRVDRIGGELLDALNEKLRDKGRQNPWKFDFHLLRDDRTINAFALPGGQVFITAALYERLPRDSQLAGVLGHEVGHVLARHGAKQMAKMGLIQGLAGAAGVAGGDAQSAQLAQAVGQLINMKYGREAELESDKWGVQLMADAGYHPEAMIDVMRVLEEASGGGPPEFLSTHPKPANRVEYIQEVIREQFPQGVPAGLKR
jgi:predicted Zn-dependent protease